MKWKQFKRRAPKLCMGLGLIVMAISFVSQSAAQSEGPGSSAPSSKPAKSASASYAGLSSIGHSGKLSSDLVELHAEYVAHLRAGKRASAFRSETPAVRVADGMVVIDTAAEGNPEKLMGEMRGLGLKNGAAFGRVVSGRFPVARLDKLEKLPGLRLARPAYAMTRAGLTTTQGDAAILSDEARATFVTDGSGVVVGSLSDSYDCLSGAADDVSSGDLPAGVTVLEELNGCSDPDPSDEGRAMMQLIHDIAPGSSQAFHTAFNGMANFANGIIELEENANADIIVDDVIYFAEPMFQDGIVAQAVDQVTVSGATYFSAAGNNGRKSYESAFNASGSPVIGDTGDAHDFGGGDVRQRLNVPAGQELIVVLQWDSPSFSVSGEPGSPNDVDLYLLDDTSTSLNQSTGDNIGGDPFEIVFYTNDNGSEAQVDLVIELIDGPEPGKLKYVIFGGATIEEFDTSSSTVYGHANAAGAEAVGATAYFNTPEFGLDPPVLNGFSSAGPTPILFDEQGDPVEIVRQKPEIVCADGGNTTFFGTDINFDDDTFPNFFGTSAAAPHAAGIAALMLARNPGLTNADIFAALEATAIDMGDSGVDDDSGYGFCQADEALAAVVPTEIAVTKSAVPSSLDEPGGNVTFTVRIDNTGDLDVTLDSLADDIHGDLDGQGDCSTGQTIASGGFDECSFDAAVSGDAGDSETDTVTATVTDTDGFQFMASDTATVSINDVQPAITVAKSASPAEVDEPGGSVTFTARVENASVESVTLSNWVDDIHGDLDGRGTCAVPQMLAVDGIYECSFTANVSGNAGHSETDTITATASDNDGNSVQASDTATVTINDVLPSISVTKAASPTSVVEPAGTVTFSARIDNSSVEPVELTVLVDDIHGDLDGRGNCSVPRTIAVDGFYECAFDATVAGEAGTSETDTITATVSDDENNQAQASDSATVDIVMPRADLALEISDSADPIRAGDSIEYTVTVSNNGPDDAPEVVMSSELPAGFTLSSTSGCLEDPDGVPTCTLGIIAAGSSIDVTIEASSDSDLDGIATLTAEVFSPEIEETKPGDEEDTEPTDVLGPDVLFRDSFESRD